MTYSLYQYGGTIICDYWAVFYFRVDSKRPF